MDFEYLIIKDQTSAKDYFEYLSLSLAYFLKFFFKHYNFSTSFIEHVKWTTYITFDEIVCHFN